MKKIKTLAAFAAFSTMMFTTSCNDDINDNLPSETNSMVKQAFESNNSTYNKYEGETVMQNTSNAELNNAFNNLFTNKSNSVSSKTRLLIVNDLNASFNEVEQVYDNGGVIAVASPTQAKIDNFFRNHPTWVGQWTESGIDGSLLYAFSNKGYHMVMADPNQNKDNGFDIAKVDNSDGFFGTETPVETDIDVSNVQEKNIDTSLPVTEEIEEVSYQDKINDLVSLWNLELTKRDSQQSLLTRAASSDDNGTEANRKMDLSSFANQEEYQVFHSFSVNKDLGNILLSSNDYMTGSGSVGITFKVTKLHAYEGSENSGDYYMVHAETSVSNENMYRGKGWWVHGAVHRRYCGFICDEFQYRMKPMLDGKVDGTVTFPYGGAPMPQTTINKTTYHNAQTFSLNASGSVSQSEGAEGGNPKCVTEGKVEVATGFTWQTSEECELSDVNILNTSSQNIVGHKVEFKNLPHFRWACDFGFDEGNSAAFRSTQVINSSWVWFKKGVSDDSTDKALTFRFETAGKYHALLFWGTEFDLSKIECNDFLNYTHDFQIKDFNRSKAFRLAINNDTDEFISHIQVIDDGGNVVVDKKNSYRAGKELYLGSFPLKKKYTVTYVKGGKTYRYNLNRWVPAENGEVTIINALNDFEANA